MPNPYITQGGGYGAMYDPEQESINQQRQMAAFLRKQAMEPVETQVVSGRVVPYSVAQGLARVLQSYSARKGEESAAEEQRRLNQQRATERGQAIEEFQRLYQGTPERRVQNMAPLVGNDPNAPQEQVIPAIQGNPQAAYAALLRARDPMLAQMGMQGIASMPQMEARKAEKQEEREFRREQMEAQLQARKEAQMAQFDQQRQMAQLAASLRPAPQERMVSVIGPDGQTPVLVPQSQARGMTPFTAAGSAQGSPMSRVRDAKDAMEILQQAAPLVNKATGSGLGNVIDTAQGFFGGSNQGAEAAAQLKVLGGALVSKMPKMSGPQSDKDVMLYKEMAGRIGDPTVPAAQKRQAMQTINELQAKYAGSEAPSLDFSERPASGGFKIIGVK